MMTPKIGGDAVIKLFIIAKMGGRNCMIKVNNTAIGLHQNDSFITKRKKPLRDFTQTMALSRY